LRASEGAIGCETFLRWCSAWVQRVISSDGNHGPENLGDMQW
jgi:hypothetical protein